METYLTRLFTKEELRRLALGLGALVVLVVAVVFYQNWRKPRVDPEAELMYLQAIFSLTSSEQLRPQAESLLRVLAETRTNTAYGQRAQYYLGALALQDGKRDDARLFLQAFLKSPLEDPLLKAEAQGLLGTLAAEEGNWDEAASWFARAEKTSPLKAYRAYALFRQALVRTYQKQYKEALRLLERMEEQYGSSALYRNEGRIEKQLIQGLLEGQEG